MESLKRSRFAAGLDDLQKHERRSESDDSTDGNSSPGSRSETSQTKSGKKTRGRVKIDMEFIDNKLRRYTTFSKRKSGIMKKAHELATLTGTQVMLLVASETGHVYTFATRKLQPILSSEAGKQLIQTCLNSPDSTDVAPSSRHDDQRMSAQGFEEPELSYVPSEDTKDGLLQKTYHMINAMSAQHEHSPPPQQRQRTSGAQQATSAESITLATMNSVTDPTKTSSHYSPSSFTLLPPQTVSPHHDQHQFQLSSAAAVRMQMVPVMQNSSSCSSISPSNVHDSLYSSVGRTTDDDRISFLNPYTNLQRPTAGVHQLLVASPRSLQLYDAQVASLDQGSDSKESSR